MSLALNNWAQMTINPLPNGVTLLFDSGIQVWYSGFPTLRWYYAHWGWPGVAKVSCILRHQGVQLILAYSWARPAVLAEGMVREGMFNFFCVFTFIHFPLSPLSLSFISTISSISLLPFSGRRHKMTHKGWRVAKPQHNQKKYYAHSEINKGC